MTINLNIYQGVTMDKAQETMLKVLATIPLVVLEEILRQRWRDEGI